MTYPTPQPASPPRHPTRLFSRFAAAITALTVYSVDLAALDMNDPFATDALAPPPPALALAVPASAQPPCPEPPIDKVYGVLEVVDLALCRNPTTREVWAAARVEAAQVGLAQSAFLPTLDGRAARDRLRRDTGSAKQRHGALTLSWLLFDFGARAAELESARQMLSAASATVDASVQSVFLDALQAYFNTQAARAAVSASLESERASRESLTAADVRYRVGSGTPADRLQAQTAWSQATLNRIRSEGLLRNAYGRLAKVMGLDANRPLRLDDLPGTVPDSGFERDVAALIAEARQRRPELQAAEAELKATQADVEQARASGRPTVSLNAGRQWDAVGELSGKADAIGVSVQLPIFTGFNIAYQVRAAEARSQVQAARVERSRQEVALEVWESYQSLTTATQTLRTSADLLASAEHSERVSLGRYKAGVGSILDVLNAQSALAAARLQRIQALLDWQVSRAALARSVGILDRGLLLTVGGRANSGEP